MTQAEQLARFAVEASYEDLTEAARRQIKTLVLDSLGCAVGSLDAEPMRCVRSYLADFGGGGSCTLIGGGTTAPDRAAFYNGGLVRYLDFNDAYLGPKGTAHPSDNLAPVLAAAEYAGGSGRDLMTALAVAYQVQCRLCDVAHVWTPGFDHTVPGAYAVAAGVSRALGLDERRAAHAVGISGAAFNALRNTRTGHISHWKGLAYPNTAFGCLHATFLAMRGVTGPLGVFEGPKGFMELITGPFEIDWSKETLEKVCRCCVKKYTAGMYAQPAVEGALELKRAHGFAPGEVERIDVGIFEVAYHVVGGGQSGDKKAVRNKETADHSLPYMVAAALIEGELMPEQYRGEFLRSGPVQDLLRKVEVHHSEACTARYPEEMATTIRVRLKDGRALEKEKSGYEGFYATPMSWETVAGKFERLSAAWADEALRKEIIEAAAGLEEIRVADLTALLGRVRTPGGA